MGGHVSTSIARSQRGPGSPEAAARTLSAGYVENMLASCAKPRDATGCAAMIAKPRAAQRPASQSHCCLTPSAREVAGA
jgi:hypothetical protein